jgi:hypothetical protein
MGFNGCPVAVEAREDGFSYLLWVHGCATLRV